MGRHYKKAPKNPKVGDTWDEGPDPAPEPGRYIPPSEDPPGRRSAPRKLPARESKPPRKGHVVAVTICEKPGCKVVSSQNTPMDDGSIKRMCDEHYLEIATLNPLPPLKTSDSTGPYREK
jgi:hypothetical protein